MSTPSNEGTSVYVIAGVNGAGKSSLLGSAIRERGGDYFNPDEATRLLIEANPGIDPREANSRAWLQGKRLLERAIASRWEFAFETTLGGTTIPALLEQAHGAGLAIRIAYVGLTTPDLHVARVRARVAHGGHSIPESRIRERFVRSRENLMRLLPVLTELRLIDNSDEGDPHLGIPPNPRLILHLLDGSLVAGCPLAEVPDWAKPIVLMALRQYGL